MKEKINIFIHRGIKNKIKNLFLDYIHAGIYEYMKMPWLITTITICACFFFYQKNINNEQEYKATLKIDYNALINRNWSEIQSSEQYKKLSENEQIASQEAFFITVIEPMVIKNNEIYWHKRTSEGDNYVGRLIYSIEKIFSSKLTDDLTKERMLFFKEYPPIKENLKYKNNDLSEYLNYGLHILPPDYSTLPDYEELASKNYAGVKFSITREPDGNTK